MKIVIYNIIFIVLTLAITPVVKAQGTETLLIVTSFPEWMFDRFKTEFEARYPQINIHVRNRKTTAAISFIQERQSDPVDVIWASAPDAFEVLKSSGHLYQLPKPVNKNNRVGSYPLHDPDGFYRGFAISGYGIMWNKLYLSEHNLPVPANWNDLTDPIYQKHLGISAPSRSGTTHLIVETILQAKGWEAGWELLMNLGGNLATVTARSFGVLDGVKKGRFGIGLVVDFFGLTAQADNSNIAFAYPDQTAFLPANIAIAKRSLNPTSGLAFIEFILSSAGQRILFESEISRLPVQEKMYKYAPQGFPNPFGKELLKKGLNFDINLSRQRYHLVNTLFDIMITFRVKRLNQVWKKIYQAESLLNKIKNESLSKKLEEARRLIGTIPVSREEMFQPKFTSIFQQHKAGIALPVKQVNLEISWKRLAQNNLKNSETLVNTILTQLHDDSAETLE